MLTKGDEFPLHQTPEPIAFATGDRNFYDRYFFNGALADGSGFFAAAFGVYPHLNIADAHVSVLLADRQVCIHASRVMDMERLDLRVGPIGIEVIEPLRRLKVTLAPTEGVAMDMTCEGMAFPLQEPRFTRRIGPRLLMDLTRFTQGVRWSGWIEVDGATQTYAPETSWGVRDRSWGVRPIGARDAQPFAPVAPPQFYWLWAPTRFADGTLMAHVNEDADGAIWNTRAAFVPDGALAGEDQDLSSPRFAPAWRAGTRQAQSCALRAQGADGQGHEIVWTPKATFLMKGLGYGHPEWGHGVYRGANSLAREDIALTGLDPTAPDTLHIQAVSDVVWRGPFGERIGVGVLEQLAVGPHAPSGLTGVFDPAKD